MKRLVHIHPSDGKAPELSVRVTAIALREFTELEKNLRQVCEKAVLERGFKAGKFDDTQARNTGDSSARSRAIGFH